MPAVGINQIRLPVNKDEFQLAKIYQRKTFSLFALICFKTVEQTAPQSKYRTPMIDNSGNDNALV